MNELEKIDFTLLALYKQTKDGGMLSIIHALEANGMELSIDELKRIKIILEHKKFAVFQIENRGTDYRGQIQPDGVVFVENDSFSNPGTSILSQEE